MTFDFSECKENELRQTVLIRFLRNEEKSKIFQSEGKTN
jgi:hypothetical protein